VLFRQVPAFGKTAPVSGMYYIWKDVIDCIHGYNPLDSGKKSVLNRMDTISVVEELCYPGFCELLQDPNTVNVRYNLRYTRSFSENLLWYTRSFSRDLFRYTRSSGKKFQKCEETASAERAGGAKKNPTISAHPRPDLPLPPFTCPSYPRNLYEFSINYSPHLLNRLINNFLQPCRRHRLSVDLFRYSILPFTE